MPSAPNVGYGIIDSWIDGGSPGADKTTTRTTTTTTTTRTATATATTKKQRNKET